MNMMSSAGELIGSDEGSESANATQPTEPRQRSSSSRTNNSKQKQSTKSESEAAVDNNSSKSPWPYLDSMFKCVSASDKICKFQCLLCKPKSKEVSAYANSPSNLRKHIEV